MKTSIGKLIEDYGVQAFKSQLLENLRKLAASMPEHQYVTQEQLALARKNGGCACSYDSGPSIIGGEKIECSPEQAKGCIFGRALRNMGIELGSSTDAICDILSDRVGYSFTKKCWDVQRAQDCGTPWGKLPLDFTYES
jgi:hypothetical protein